MPFPKQGAITDNTWLVLAMSDNILEQSYEWLCKQRRDYSHNSDTWAFRQHWAETKSELVRQVMAGGYQFSPLQRYCIEGETVTCWCAQDALLLKAMTLVLTDKLAPCIPDCCYHLAGRGGTKAAIQDIKNKLEANQFVMRTDVKGYYDSIEHVPLYETLNGLVPDKAFCRQIRGQYPF